MNKYIKLIPIIVIAFACFFIGFFIKSEPETFVPSFQVIGDVQEVLTISNLDEYEKSEFTYKDETLSGVSVADVVTGILDENSSLFYVGTDGLTSEVDARTVEKSYILFSEDNGWEIINTEHPISSNIKLLKEIIVVSNEEISDYSFTIFDDDENFFSFTTGQLMLENYELYRRFEGESKVEDNSVTVYTSHKIIDIQTLIADVTEETQCVVFLESGAIELSKLDGYLDIADNQINYISYEKSYEFEDVVGIYLGKTLAFLGDVYYDMEHYLENDENVMLIYIDGFNFETLETATEMGIIPNISNGEIKKAFSVYTSVTNAGFASMITGTTPDVNGIHTRDERTMLVPSIFEIASNLGVQTSFLEASTKILDTEIEPTLHLHGDLSIIETAKTDIEEGAEFVFMHLHELDELGHSYGPDGELLYEYLEEVDVKLGEIIDAFDGTVIITTDHGMHNTEDAGDHGDMRYEDMIIPIIYVK